MSDRIKTADITGAMKLLVKVEDTTDQAPLIAPATSKRNSQEVTVAICHRKPGVEPGRPYQLLVYLADGRCGKGFFAGSQTHMLAQEN